MQLLTTPARLANPSVRDPRLIALLEAANLLLALDCFLIPLCLFLLLAGIASSESLRQHVRHVLYQQLSTPSNFLVAIRHSSWLIGLLGGFLLLMGCSRVLGLFVLFYTIRWQQASLSLLTGIVGFLAATLLLRWVIWTIREGRQSIQ